MEGKLAGRGERVIPKKGREALEALASGERALWCRTGWETGGEFLAPQSLTREGP